MKKIQKRIIIILCVAFVCVMCIGTLDLGTEDRNDILYISSPEDLENFSKSVNEGNTYQDVHVVLTCDIDMSKVANFTPIGQWGQGNYFCGVFNGNGHVIRNLTIVPEESEGTEIIENLGLFGTLGGIVCNLTIENCYVRGNACGAFCCIAADEGISAILNCEVKNSEINAEFTSIIGGQYFGIVENCVIDGQGDSEVLNSNLKEIWDKYGIGQLNTWVDTEEGISLSMEKAEVPEKVYLKIENIYDGEIYPIYSAEAGCNVFCVPSIEGNRKAVLVLEMANGSIVKEEIALPCKKAEVEVNHETYEFQFLNSENTATVFIDVDGEGNFKYLRESKETILLGIVWVADEKGQCQYIGELERIRSRGNNSWFEPKQSFSFKLMQSGDILGMGRDKDYVLLPGYRDSSLLAYQITWDLCKEFKWEHALSGEMVQLYVDGDYWGLYLLTEKVEAGAERIPVEQSNDKTGGFVYEYSAIGYEEREIAVTAEHGNGLVFTSPVFPTKEQIEYSHTLWNDIEEAVYSPDGYNSKGKHYTEYIDLESFATQWLLYEMYAEVSVKRSVYFYKHPDSTGDGKLYAYQPWDMEHSCAWLDMAYYRRMAGSTEFWRLLGTHEEFAEEIRRQWKEKFLPALDKLLAEGVVENPEGISSIDYYIENLRAASLLEEFRWGKQQSIPEKGEAIKKWFDIRIPFLSENLYTDEFFMEE
ncbi:MAG: CotH kinase family protein [Lachnospiraceae bacterium]|nr:CotH kinase family protein [Lachnospiraceae bacterium]